jgi:hypothetical protein
MLGKIISPVGFPLTLLALFWFSERNKNPDHKPDRKKMRFWIGCCSLMACGEYAMVWHNEIGLAWQNHPELTVFSTLAVVAAIFATAGPPPDFIKKL